MREMTSLVLRRRIRRIKEEEAVALSTKIMQNPRGFGVQLFLKKERARGDKDGYGKYKNHWIEIKIEGVFYKGNEYAKLNPNFVGCVEGALGIRECLESQGHHSTLSPMTKKDLILGYMGDGCLFTLSKGCDSLSIWNLFISQGIQPIHESHGYVAIVVGSVLGLALLLLLLCLRWRWRQLVKSPKSVVAARVATPAEAGTLSSKEDITGGLVEAERNKLMFFEGGIYSFVLEDLLRASMEVLGKGSVGTSYKAVLEEGTTVVVKRPKDVVVTKKEFEMQMKVLGKIKHENVVLLKAFYFSKDEKLLVYDYMSAGSLSALLHSTMLLKSLIHLSIGSGLVGEDDALGSSRAVAARIESSYMINLCDLDMRHVLETTDLLSEVTESVDYYVQGKTLATRKLFGR
ncbi:hypothetical protein JHK87_015657 [Glycine soja]|nr:hypothetical protein JHK87_015657 [Glycine soja]